MLRIALCLITTLMFAGTVHADLNVLALTGSTHADSVNKKLVKEAAEVAHANNCNVTVIDLKDYPMPFYDADLEAAEGMPANAKTLRQLMLNSQVVIIASPEYNHSIPAVLKNALDWISRSENAERSRDAYAGKTFVLLSASPGKKGGAKGLIHLKDIIEDQRGIVQPQQFSLPDAYNAFDENGHLKDAQHRESLKLTVEAALKDS